jgi:hypothetical protein
MDCENGRMKAMDRASYGDWIWSDSIVLCAVRSGPCMGSPRFRMRGSSFSYLLRLLLSSMQMLPPSNVFHCSHICRFCSFLRNPTQMKPVHIRLESYPTPQPAAFTASAETALTNLLSAVYRLYQMQLTHSCDIQKDIYTMWSIRTISLLGKTGS